MELSNVGQIERLTQARVLKLFCESLGYDYLGNWKDRAGNRNVDAELLERFLVKQGYDDNLVGRARHIVDKAADAKANTKRPDVVLYVNGIALAVLELKRSTVSVAEGIRQNPDNQKPIFIEPFFFDDAAVDGWQRYRRRALRQY